MKDPVSGNEPDDELQEICKELDETALLYLEKIEEYAQGWQSTADRLQQVRMGPTTLKQRD